MRLNLKGQALGRGHIDGHPLPDIGGTDYCWLTEDVPICASGNTIQKYEHGAWAVVEQHGANWLRAGKGRYFSMPGLGDFAPADVDPYTGTAVLTRYSTGSDIILVELDGTVVNVPTGSLGTDAVAFRNARQRDGWLLYQTTGVWLLRRGAAWPITPIEARTEWVDYAVPVSIGGNPLLLERANGRLSLRYPDTTLGWLVHVDTASDGLVAPDALYINGKVRVSWSNNQSESAAVWAVQDVALDDSKRIDLNAEVLPPVEQVPLLNRTFGLACYTFNNHDTLGNLSLPIRPQGGMLGTSPFIATIDDESSVPEDVLWAIYSGAVNSSADLKPARDAANTRKRGLAIYQDKAPMSNLVVNLAGAYDILTPQVYRNQSEPLDHYAQRLQLQYMDCAMFAECWPTVNIHRRYGPNGPTLSVKEVVDGFIVACKAAQAQNWPGMVLFRVGTSDVPEEIIPYIERFLSGITGTPEARIIPDEPPVEPVEPKMPYVMVAAQVPGDPVLRVIKINEENRGGELYLNKSDGRKLSMTDQGKVEDRNHDAYGPWEQWIKTGKGYVSKAHNEKFGILAL